MVLTVALFAPTITFASGQESSTSMDCQHSVWDMGNYPPSSLEEAQAIETANDCGDDGICLTSVRDLGNYPPSSVMDAHASSDVTDCGEGDVCQIEVAGVASLNLAPYSALNAHSIAEDRMEPFAVAENFAPWSTRDAHAISEGSAAFSANTCDVCVTMHGFGAQTTACDLAWECDDLRISDPQIPTEVLRQAEFASGSGC